MKIIIENPSESVANYFRRAGYTFQKREGEEMAFVRRLTDQPFPRFHLFARIESFSAKGGSASGGSFHVNFHIDHKAASYEGSSMHSGEYGEDSNLLQEEAERLKKIV